MQLDEALRQISDIRQKMVRSEVFRGYRSVTVGFSGVAGVLAAAVQQQWVASPDAQLGRYLGLWLGVAAASMIVAATEMYWRARRTGSGMARQHTLLAIEQFVPSMVVGALVTVTIVRGAPQVAWMLPGLWRSSLVSACSPPLGCCPGPCWRSGRTTCCVDVAVCCGDRRRMPSIPGRWGSVLVAASCWARRSCTGH